MNVPINVFHWADWWTLAARRPLWIAIEIELYELAATMRETTTTAPSSRVWCHRRRRRRQRHHDFDARASLRDTQLGVSTHDGATRSCARKARMRPSLSLYTRGVSEMFSTCAFITSRDGGIFRHPGSGSLRNNTHLNLCRRSWFLWASFAILGTSLCRDCTEAGESVQSGVLRKFSAQGSMNALVARYRGEEAKGTAWS